MDTKDINQLPKSVPSPTSSQPQSSDTKSTGAKNIYEALFLFQKEVAPIKKANTNTYHHSKYADINDVLDEIKPLLTKQGILLMQPIKFDEMGNILETILLHVESDTRVESSIRLVEFGDSQKNGSNITYYRRYALVALLGLEGEDEDGNDSSPKSVQPSVGLKSGVWAQIDFKDQEGKEKLKKAGAKWNSNLKRWEMEDTENNKALIKSVTTKYGIIEQN